MDQDFSVGALLPREGWPLPKKSTMFRCELLRLIASCLTTGHATSIAAMLAVQSG